MSTLHLHSNGPERTREIGRVIASTLRGGDVIALEGPLGSGKTCLVRGLAEGLGIAPDAVSSPTFVICQEHGLDRPVALFHIDAYRVSGADELETIGYQELLDGAHGVIAIEWASRVASALPDDHVVIEFAHVGPAERDISVTGPTPWIERAEAVIGAEPVKEGGPCPICEKPIDPAGADAPFCSPRCRTIDLGRWLGGNYKISRPIWGTEEEGD